MYEISFHSIEDLKKKVIEDKESAGIGLSTRNRYPIRFVLLDNFRDCYAFVEYLQSERNVQVESVDKWIDKNYPDLMITQVELANKIEEYINEKSPKDCVIAPFSELARFYDNEQKKAFDALIRTIKGIQTDTKGFEQAQRVYIPIVGLEGKMESFLEDSQITIWRLLSTGKDLTYRLVLTNGADYKVKGLSTKYTIVNNIKEWLNLWKDTESQSTPNIICKSTSIFANAIYAQPDNAFSYTICNNAYDFLTSGLQLSFGGLKPTQKDGNNWDKMAEIIDISEGFNFNHFVKNLFGTNEIEGYKDFIRIWFTKTGVFDRWLLAGYYQITHQEDYLTKIIQSIHHFGNNDLIECLIVETNENAKDMEMRRYCLKEAAKHHIVLSDAAEGMVDKNLNELSKKLGYSSALHYFSGISKKEKEILIDWYRKGNITIDQVKDVYPDLYHYAKEGVGLADVEEWVENYMETYKKAKISNVYTDEISKAIHEINGKDVTFNTWYNKFRSTYTLLYARNDIEVFFWIDGLGIDWIPLVKAIIAEKNEQNIYLNEVKIAKSLLPSKTDINRKDLERLLPEGTTLEKAGDLDSLAHKTNNISPFTINTEIEIVRKTIEDILIRFNGKKIAIVSDHGLSYLPQLTSGKNIAGIDSDHHGRIGVRQRASNSHDDSYFVLDDQKTLCALQHESLCGKVPANQGCHGGCTPEEVLVPIFIISNVMTATNWSAECLDLEINGTNPYLHFTIKNIPPTEKPSLLYNNVRYKLQNIGNDKYQSEAINIDSKENIFTLEIGKVSRVFNIFIKSGVDEDDPFL